MKHARKVRSMCDRHLIFIHAAANHLPSKLIGEAFARRSAQTFMPLQDESVILHVCTLDMRANGDYGGADATKRVALRQPQVVTPDDGSKRWP